MPAKIACPNLLKVPVGYWGDESQGEHPPGGWLLALA